MLATNPNEEEKHAGCRQQRPCDTFGKGFQAHQREAWGGGYSPTPRPIQILDKHIARPRKPVRKDCPRGDTRRLGMAHIIWSESVPSLVPYRVQGVTNMTPSSQRRNELGAFQAW